MENRTSVLKALPLIGGLMMTGHVALALPAHEAEQVTVTQQQTSILVKGKIVDSSGNPMIGVNVVEKGTKHITVTDDQGNFSLKVSPNAILKVSSIGYKAQSVEVKGQRTLNIQMEETADMMGEVVVVGYGTVRKADLAGSVAVLDNKSFKDQPITQVSEALQGRVSGVNVVSSGIPGGSVKVRIRGNNSINKSNDPLYVVDGMVRESGLEGLNTEDIKSMQVLKDASSTAIYGSRGANGVVIITTKSGVKGQASITFDASVGVSQAINLPKKMGTQEYAQALIDFNKIDPNELTDYLNGTNPGIDWLDVMFRNGVTQNYKLVFSKGTDNLQAYISGNYMKNEGVLEGSSYERYTAKAKVSARMKKWLDVTLDIDASHGVGKGIGGIEMSGYNPLWRAYNYSPTMNMFDENGNYAKDPYGNINENPYADLAAIKSERRNDVFNGRVDLKFNILEGLTFTSSNGIDYHNNTSYGFTPECAYQKANSMSNSNRQRMMLQSSNNLTYMHSWNNKHHLTATAVWEATKSDNRNMRISGQNIQAESVEWWNITNALNRDAKNGYSDWAMLSGVGRIIYNYADRYLLTGTFRADGSSRFTNNKWGYFPSIAAAWTVSNEKFMENCRDVISNLKIRTSYGVIGNQDIAPYSTLGTLTPTGTFYGTPQSITGYWADKLATPDLKWEKTKQFDFGVDLGFFNNRLTLSLDYFNKQTSDALLTTHLADYLGGTPYLVNAGKVSNQGLDISLDANIIQGPEWGWSTTLTGTFLKNKVKKLTAQQPILYGGSFQAIVEDATITKEGEAIGTFFGYRWAGIDAEGYDTYYTADGEVTRKPTTKDRVVLGKSTPDFTLGWNNTVRYKNFTLNAFFNSAFGMQRLNVLRFAMNSMIGNSRTITDADFIGEIGKTMPNPTVADNQYIGNSSKWIENASYFRCENVTLAYDLSKDVTKFADMRFSFSIQNLFTISGYKGADPAGYSFSSNEGDRSTGIDAGTCPLPRTFTLGVRMTF